MSMTMTTIPKRLPMKTNSKEEAERLLLCKVDLQLLNIINQFSIIYTHPTSTPVPSSTPILNPLPSNLSPTPPHPKHHSLSQIPPINRQRHARNPRRIITSEKHSALSNIDDITPFAPGGCGDHQRADLWVFVVYSCHYCFRDWDG